MPCDREVSERADGQLRGLSKSPTAREIDCGNRSSATTRICCVVFCRLCIKKLLAKAAVHTHTHCALALCVYGRGGFAAVERHSNVLRHHKRNCITGCNQAAAMLTSPKTLCQGQQSAWRGGTRHQQPSALGAGGAGDGNCRTRTPQPSTQYDAGHACHASTTVKAASTTTRKLCKKTTVQQSAPMRSPSTLLVLALPHAHTPSTIHAMHARKPITSVAHHRPCLKFHAVVAGAALTTSSRPPLSLP